MTTLEDRIVKSLNGQLENLVPGTSNSTSGADRKKMPKVVIGLIHGELARVLEVHFRNLGWRVCIADTALEMRAKAHGGRASVVVVPVTAFDTESAFLTCAKLVNGLPKARVFLVGPDSVESERFALFAGAAGYIPETTTASELIRLINGPKSLKNN
jgi:hypothetical protein